MAHVRRSAPSISDVARAAGVSMGTVSNVLNGTARVTPATRERVEAAIRELGFVRNGVARSLAAGRSSTLGFVIIDLSNSYFLDIARGAEAEAGTNGLNLLLANSDMSEDKQRTYLDLFEEERVAGILMAPNHGTAKDILRPSRRGVPVVVVDEPAEGADVCAVVPDNTLGGYLAARHLIDAGRRRLLFAGTTELVPVRDRLAGVERAVAESSGVLLEVEQTGNVQVEDGRRVGDDIALRQPGERPDGEQAPGGAVADAPAGAVPNFVPWIPCGFPEWSTAAWGDAAVVVPWTMYERYGDRQILAQQLDSMTGWVDHLASRADADGVVRSGFGLGDWLDPIAPPENPGAGRTDRHLVTTAYIARSAGLLVRAAEVLGHDDVAVRYRKVAELSTAGFQAEHVLPDGRMKHESPTGYSLAIAFDLLATAEQRAVAGARLAEIVREGGYRIQTGFVGTPIICDALAGTGHVDVAYRLLLERECPSWLYPVTMGATTIWERWDSMLPDGSVNPGDMTSFNHYALGAVVDFMHRVVAGLAPAAPGYRRLRVEPRPGPGLDRASARLTSPYGPVSTAWTLDGDRFELALSVPFGVSADVVLPDGATHEVGAGDHAWTAVVPRAATLEED